MKLIEFFKDFEPKSDKNTSHCYIEQYYSGEFSDKKELPIRLMEIGIRQGYSHILWDKYFTNGEIWGVDDGESGFTWDILNSSRVRVLKDDAYKVKFITSLPENYFDYIIDDGSHHPEHQKIFIDLYYHLLKPGGKLIIEDIQGRGYLDTLDKYCKTLKLDYKLLDFTSSGKLDDLMIEITRI